MRQTNIVIAIPKDRVGLIVENWAAAITEDQNLRRLVAKVMEVANVLEVIEAALPAIGVRWNMTALSKDVFDLRKLCEEIALQTVLETLNGEIALTRVSLRKTPLVTNTPTAPIAPPP